MGTFLHVLSEQYRTEHFFGVERSVLTEHLDLVFPRTLLLKSAVVCDPLRDRSEILGNFI